MFKQTTMRNYILNELDLIIRSEMGLTAKRKVLMSWIRNKTTSRLMNIAIFAAGLALFVPSMGSGWAYTVSVIACGVLVVRELYGLAILSQCYETTKPYFKK